MIALIANILKPEVEEESTPDTATPTPGGGRTDTNPDRFVTEDGLVEQLVNALEDGEVTEAQRAVLRDHLSPNGTNDLEVKLNHLRSKVNDLEAYTDALEEFISEEGTAEEVLEGLRRELHETTDAVEDIDSRVETLEATSESLRARVGDLEAEVGSVETAVEELEGRHSREIAGVDARVDRLQNSLPAELTAVQEDVTRIEEQLDSLSAVQQEVQTVQESLAELEDFRTKFVETVTADAP